jgi:hypothetical protein
MLETVDSEMVMAVTIGRVLKAPQCSSSSVFRSLPILTLAVGVAGSGQETGLCAAF